MSRVTSITMASGHVGRVDVAVGLEGGETIHVGVGECVPERLCLLALLGRVDEALSPSREVFAFAEGTRARAVADLRSFSERISVTMRGSLGLSLPELAAKVAKMEVRMHLES